MRPFSAAVQLLSAALVACAIPHTTAPEPPAAVSPYVAELDAWHAEHIADMVSDTGPLTQVGLHQLIEGTWTLGSAEDADFVLPARVPARLGELTVAGETVRFTAADDVEVLRFGSDPRQRVEQIELTAPSADGGPRTLACDRLLLHVIDRGGVLLLRVRDQDSPARNDFVAAARYPVDTRYRVTARLVPGTAAMHTMQLKGGLASTALSLGLLEFELDGQTYQLRPNFEADGSLFLVFADATTGTETYATGRFLSAPPLDADGRVVLDFNRATTPVCAWNAFSTCPRALPQNTLPIALRAGERFTRRH